MSIMVEYDLPEWCDGCNALSTEKHEFGDMYFSHYLTCEHLSFCNALRTHWKLDDKQTDVEDLIKNAPTTSWISTKERLPDVGEYVFIYTGGLDHYISDGMLDYFDIEAAYIEICADGYVWTCDNWTYQMDEVKYWMPLPEPPKKGETDD